MIVGVHVAVKLVIDILSRFNLAWKFYFLSIFICIIVLDTQSHNNLAMGDFAHIHLRSNDLMSFFQKKILYFGRTAVKNRL